MGRYGYVAAAVACLSVALLMSGCRHAPDDATLAQTVQSQLAADSSIAGQAIQATVQGGVVVLNGSVQNAAQKTIAARDAAGVTGIREVRNNIAIATQQQEMAAAAVPPAPPIPEPGPALANSKTKQMPPPPHQPAPIERPGFSQQPQPQTYVAPPPAPPPPAVEAPAPPPPPQQVYKQLTLAAGSTLPVRMTQTLDSATTQQGTTFSGVIESDILVDGLVAIPAGTSVSGTVDAVQEAAHYKGVALLTVSLASVSRKGERMAVTTEPYSVQGKGRGANTAEKIGGGAAVGAIIGGIFGGGKGAAIGAGAGGGLGAGANTVTRGQQVQIESESVVRFRLATPMTVRVRTDLER